MSELPESWLTIKLSEDVVYKKGKKPKLLFLENENNVLDPYIDIKAFEKGIIRKYAHPDDGVKALPDETLMVWDGARSGLVGNGIEGVIGSTLMRIKPIASNKNYFHFFLESQYGNINTRTKGMGIPHVDPAVLWNISYPLAPLNAQVRIANKLDSLLGKLEATQKHLDKIPTLLKRFRQSVLAAAVSGELTAEWRKLKNTTFKDWQEYSFDDLCREITVGFVGKMKDKYQDTGIPFLRSQNVRAFRFSPKNLLYISEEFHQEIFKSRLEAGDLAIVRSGAPGTTCVIPKSLGIANCSDLVIARPNEKLNAHYAAIYMNSESGRSHVASKQVGVAQQHFNVGSMKKTMIHLPSIEEQKQIVQRVESLFNLADKVEQQYQTAKQNTDKLTQSLLAKAFRGKLVPQDPNDEHASELLKRIQVQRKVEQESKQKAPKKRIIKSKPQKAKAMTLSNAPKEYLSNLLREMDNEASAKDLWNKSEMVIDDFYCQLKTEMETSITEEKGSSDPSMRLLKIASQG